MKQYFILLFLYFSVAGCKGQYSNHTESFKGTPAYDLAKAVERGETKRIEKLVTKDSSLLNVYNPINGGNVLFLALYVEESDSFQKLLELGADPNAVNFDTQYSILMEAIRPFGNQFEWRKEYSYAQLLLSKGADPNYMVKEDFTNKKGNSISASSPLFRASELDLDMVKLLIRHGADPFIRVRENQSTPFSSAVRRGKIDIINYYIDSLQVDINKPLSVIVRKPANEEVKFYIQDYLVNRFTLAKLKGNTEEVQRLKDQNEGIEEANEELWQLILKLKALGVDFKNYQYKL